MSVYPFLPFPGKEHLIKIWRPEDLQFYHSLHYRPDNVVLYVVGDLDSSVGGVKGVEDLIEQKFGKLQIKIDAHKVCIIHI
ncbi:insulinase family protein [archaeon]|nr:MAG: insulinase family protein [archaeon]